MIGFNITALQASGELGIESVQAQNTDANQVGTSFANLLASLKSGELDRITPNVEQEDHIAKLFTQILDAFIEMHEASLNLTDQGSSELSQDTELGNQIKSFLAALGEELEAQGELTDFLEQVIMLTTVFDANQNYQNIIQFNQLQQQIYGQGEKLVSHDAYAAQNNQLERWLQNPQEFIQLVQRISYGLEQQKELLSQFGASGRDGASFAALQQLNTNLQQSSTQANLQQAIANELSKLDNTQVHVSALTNTSTNQNEGELNQQARHQLAALSNQSSNQQAALHNEKVEFVLDTRVTQATQASERLDAKQELPTARFTKLIEDISTLLQGTIKGKQEHNGTQLRIQLHPEHLGQLDIRITSIQGKISATVYASHALAKEVIDLSLNQLRQTLTQQGIVVDKLEVTQAQSNSTSSHSEQHGSQHTHQQQKSKQLGSMNLAEQSAEIASGMSEDPLTESTIDFTA